MPERAEDVPSRRIVALAALLPVGVLLVGVAMRIAMRPTRDFDERFFLSVGRSLLETGLPIARYDGVSRLFFDHTPLYAYFVALLEALGGPTTLIIRASSLGFGILTVLGVFWIALRVHGLGSALVGSVLVAANPFFITYSWFIRMEVPLCLFLVLAVYLLIRERFLLAGLSIMVAVMLKEIALGFWLVAVVWVFARSGLRAAAAVAIPAPVAVAGWLAYAASLDLGVLITTLERWGRSAVGDEPDTLRFQLTPLVWLYRVLAQVDRRVPDVRCGCRRRPGSDEARRDPPDRGAHGRVLRARDRGVVRDEPQGAALPHRRDPDAGAVHRAGRRLGRGVGANSESSRRTKLNAGRWYE